MATETNKGLCVRVPRTLRQRLNRISKLRLKSPSEVAREALLDYVERRERELKVSA